MDTPKTQYSLVNARDYFAEHPSVGDYYHEGQRVAGQWCGLGAEILELSWKVRGDDCLRLCENQNPSSGLTLNRFRARCEMTSTGQEKAASKGWTDCLQLDG